VWPLPTIENELITLSLNPTELTCAWITQEKNRTKPTLKALKKISITNCAFENNIIFSPKFLYTHVAQFIEFNKLHNAFITCALSGPSVIQEIIAFQTATPTLDDLKKDDFHKKIWNIEYLYPTDEAQFQYYIAGIPRELLFQYQLFIRTVSLNLLTITTPFIAQFQVYQHMHNYTIRQEQLAQDMKYNNNDLY